DRMLHNIAEFDAAPPILSLRNEHEALDRYPGASVHASDRAVEDDFDLVELVEMGRGREGEIESLRDGLFGARNRSYRSSPQTLRSSLGQISVQEHDLERNGLRRRVGVQNRQLQAAAAAQADRLLQLLTRFHLHGKVVRRAER